METKVKGRVENLPMSVDFSEVLSDEYYHREQEQIFRRAWLAVGHTTSIPNPHDYFVRDLPGINVSLLIVRGKDGQVRAFHNVCRHRGFQVERTAKGNKRAFSCSFHGWLYDTQGALIGVTDEDHFADLDRCTHGLVPVHTEIWETFIFVNLAPEPPVPLHEWLGELADIYTGYFDSFGPAEVTRTEVKSNWNLAVNAFTENYHTLYLHKQTVPDYQGSPSNPLRILPAMELLERHARYSTPSNPFREQRPAEKIAYSYTRPAMPSFISDTTGLPSGINFERVENWAFDVIELFPNTVILTGNGWVWELSVWPNGPDSALMEYRTLLEPTKNYAQLLAQEFTHSQVIEVVMEDLSTLEKQQTMLKTKAVSIFPLSEQEIVIAHHYRVAKEMMEKQK